MAEKRTTTTDKKATAPKTETKVEKAVEKATDAVKAEVKKAEEKAAPVVKKVANTAKTTTTKATKAATKKAEEVKSAAEEVKAEVTKKVAAKKTTSTKQKKTNVFIQYNFQEISEDALITRIVDKWVAETGKRESSIKTLDVYIKPEDNAAYYVINGQGSSISLF